MNDSGPNLPSNAEKRLGAAQFAVAALVALGVVDLVVRLALAGDWERMSHLGSASYVVVLLGFNYLVWTILCAWQTGGRLRAGGRLGGSEARLDALAHGLVLGAAAWVMVRGSDSATLFAGLDRLVAVLVATAALALGLMLVSLWRASLGAQGQPLRRASVLLLLASTALVVALLWLEYA